MKQLKILVQLTLTGLLLAFGTLACAQAQPEKADAKAEPVVAPEAQPVPAEADPHHAEPNAADWKTKLEVKMALLEKLGADSLHIDVTSREGAVRLSGTVEKRETKELAETIAESIPAVTSIQNDVLLESNVDNPSQADVAAGETEAELKDALLSTKVRLVLVDGLGSDGFRIGTEVADGVVTLEFGPELTALRREEAIKAAEGVEGVTKVVSVEKT